VGREEGEARMGLTLGEKKGLSATEKASSEGSNGGKLAKREVQERERGKKGKRDGGSRKKGGRRMKTPCLQV